MRTFTVDGSTADQLILADYLEDQGFHEIADSLRQDAEFTDASDWSFWYQCGVGVISSVGVLVGASVGCAGISSVGGHWAVGGDDGVGSEV